MITHVNVTVLYVDDLDRSREFYTDGLGFTEKTVVELGPGRWWHELVLPGADTAVALVRAADFGVEVRPGMALTLRCDDVATTVRQLRERGVTVADPESRPWGTSAQVHDPDGHLLVLGETAS